MNKGLAWVHQEFTDDYDALKAHWYYDWGVSTGKLSDPEYAPMLVDALPSTKIPSDYDGHILVMNEPNNTFYPYITGVDPETAAQRVVVLCSSYPNAKIRIGGCSIYGEMTGHTWNFRFQTEYRRLTDKWWKNFHQHVYFETGKPFCWWMDRFQNAMFGAGEPADGHSRPAGINWWITECGFVDLEPENWWAFKQALEMMSGNTTVYRYAAFTSRLSGEEPWCPPRWEDSNIPMFDWDTGEMTRTGQVYSYLG